MEEEGTGRRARGAGDEEGVGEGGEALRERLLEAMASGDVVRMREALAAGVGGLSESEALVKRVRLALAKREKRLEKAGVLEQALSSAVERFAEPGGCERLREAMAAVNATPRFASLLAEKLTVAGALLAQVQPQPQPQPQPSTTTSTCTTSSSPAAAAATPSLQHTHTVQQHSWHVSGAKNSGLSPSTTTTLTLLRPDTGRQRRGDAFEEEEEESTTGRETSDETAFGCLTVHDMMEPVKVVHVAGQEMGSGDERDWTDVAAKAKKKKKKPKDTVKPLLHTPGASSSSSSSPLPGLESQAKRKKSKSKHRGSAVETTVQQQQQLGEQRVAPSAMLGPLPSTSSSNSLLSSPYPSVMRPSSPIPPKEPLFWNLHPDNGRGEEDGIVNLAEFPALGMHSQQQTSIISTTTTNKALLTASKSGHTPHKQQQPALDTSLAHHHHYHYHHNNTILPLPPSASPITLANLRPSLDYNQSTAPEAPRALLPSHYPPLYASSSPSLLGTPPPTVPSLSRAASMPVWDAVSTTTTPASTPPPPPALSPSVAAALPPWFTQTHHDNPPPAAVDDINETHNNHNHSSSSSSVQVLPQEPNSPPALLADLIHMLNAPGPMPPDTPPQPPPPQPRFPHGQALLPHPPPPRRTNSLPNPPSLDAQTMSTAAFPYQQQHYATSHLDLPSQLASNMPDSHHNRSSTMMHGGGGGAASVNYITSSPSTTTSSSSSSSHVQPPLVCTTTAPPPHLGTGSGSFGTQAAFGGGGGGSGTTYFSQQPHSGPAPPLLVGVAYSRFGVVGGPVTNNSASSSSSSSSATHPFSRQSQSSTSRGPILGPPLASTPGTLPLSAMMAAPHQHRSHHPLHHRGSRQALEGPWAGAMDVDDYCCLCMDNPKNAALIPCGHRMCKDCAESMRQLRRACPLCNRDITDVLLLFG